MEEPFEDSASKSGIETPLFPKYKVIKEEPSEHTTTSEEESENFSTITAPTGTLKKSVKLTSSLKIILKKTEQAATPTRWRYPLLFRP